MKGIDLEKEICKAMHVDDSYKIKLSDIYMFLVYHKIAEAKKEFKSDADPKSFEYMASKNLFVTRQVGGFRFRLRLALYTLRVFASMRCRRLLESMSRAK